LINEKDNKDSISRLLNYSFRILELLHTDKMVSVDQISSAEFIPETKKMQCQIKNIYTSC